ncbi:MAG: hypothetical protein ACTSVV_12730, partial [Promethearchaeota archaeon]
LTNNKIKNMLKVDIIIPPTLLSFQKYQKPPFLLYKRNIKWFPLWFFKDTFKQYSLEFNFKNILNFNINKLEKKVGIDSEISHYIKNLKNYLMKLKKKVDFIAWFDHSDSASYLVRESVPYVDCYLKKQVLKNRELYNNNFINDRIYSDYYYKMYFKKENSWIPKKLKKLKKKELDKITLSWNLGLCDYNNLFLDDTFFKKIPQYLSFFLKNRTFNYINPSKNRELLFSANFGINYSDNFVSYHRKQLLKILSNIFDKNVNYSVGVVSKKKYLDNLKKSKAVFSPFGYGEICFRDFETFIAGATLIKPDISHIETWPNLFEQNKTYISFPWNFEEWNDELFRIFNNETKLFQVAKEGQKRYKKIWTLEGKRKFCERLKRIFEN